MRKLRVILHQKYPWSFRVYFLRRAPRAWSTEKRRKVVTWTRAAKSKSREKDDMLALVTPQGWLAPTARSIENGASHLSLEVVEYGWHRSSNVRILGGTFQVACDERNARMTGVG